MSCGLGPRQKRKVFHMLDMTKESDWDHVLFNSGLIGGIIALYRELGIPEKEWKVVNPYHVSVRRKNAVTGRHVKMSLQLYQVDQKSFLLDFKSLNYVPEPGETLNTSSQSLFSPVDMTNKANHSSAKHLPDHSSCSLSSDFQDDRMDIDEEPLKTHLTLEFFEMCASLITTLAR